MNKKIYEQRHFALKRKKKENGKCTRFRKIVEVNKGTKENPKKRLIEKTFYKVTW